jgi:catechol 2,3-dioxygenase-like lactoylglutathione lyase family enzyme
MERMELLGVVVHDLDAAVARYTALFGLEFHVFTPGRDYRLTDTPGAEVETDPAPSLPAGCRLAMDTSGCFELVELAGAPEGVRNIHFRVDDIDSAAAHLTANGLRAVADLQAGTVREVLFDASGLNGVRLCIVQYEGRSFADALRASPAP